MAEMAVSKASVRSFLQSGKKFVIPQYQRPYSWQTEQCETLWADIFDFFEAVQNNSTDESEYFLGSIVAFIDDNNKNTLEIIDGQQRLTTLTLLFRALYEKASDSKFQDAGTKGFAKAFGKCIWKYDEGSEELIFEQRHLTSQVILDTDNNAFNKLLSQKHEFDTNEKELLYVKNYEFFCKKIDEFAQHNPNAWGNFCKTILDKLVILPIECNSQDNALRIFTTLNDRGLPLSDSDVIKGKIFADLSDADERNKFAQNWKKLEEKITDDKNGFGMNFLFSQYMHVLRARDGNTSKEIALRSFYLKSDYKKYLKADLIGDLSELADFWLGEFDDKMSLNARQVFDVLWLYPNDYWKFLVSAYYFYCKDRGLDFFDDVRLLPFLRKTICYLFVLFVDKPTVNAIKDPVFKAYKSLYDNKGLDFGKNISEILKQENFKKDFLKISNLTKPMLRLNLYNKCPEQEILAGEIEHIFPKKWQDTNYNGWNEADAKDRLEQIGNKMWLEKHLNIQAGNNYFAKKKEKYKNSKYLEAKELANYSKPDWTKEDIIARNEEIFGRFLNFCEKNL